MMRYRDEVDGHQHAAPHELRFGLGFYVAAQQRLVFADLDQ